MTTTYWNGLPTKDPGLRGTAIVADAPEFSEYWAKDLVGERIPVVRIDREGVNHGGGVTYLDNRDGSGWAKVTEGHGSPSYGHRNVRVESGSFEADRDAEQASIYEQEAAELFEMADAYAAVKKLNDKDEDRIVGVVQNRSDRRAASKKSRKKARRA